MSAGPSKVPPEQGHGTGPSSEPPDKLVALSFDDGRLAAAEDLSALFEESARHRYLTLDKVGEGRVGAVYRAQDRRLGRIVALKRIHPEVLDSPQTLRQFVEQTRAIASLNHFNIVQVYDIERDEDGHFIAMEYVAGETLGALLERSGPQPLLQAVEWGRQLCNALAVAHRQGVVHGDIRPANVLLAESNVPKLTDFGLAFLLHANEIRSTSGQRVSPYAPPELLAGQALDARADIYGLAATLYHVLTGKPPAPVHADDLPPPIRPVLLKALDADRERRYATIGELAAALKNIALAAEPAPAVRPQEVRCPQCGRDVGSDVEFCGACGFAVQKALRVNELLAQARELLYQGANEKALRQYEAVLELDEQHEEARQAAERIRQSLNRVAELREKANSLTSSGALQKAVEAWRELLTLVPNDLEAAGQIRKCEEELQARQIVTLLTGARFDIRMHRFEAAEQKCAQVLKTDPHNAEATALKWLIPQARQQWLQTLVRLAVEAYRSGDYRQAHLRFSEACAAAERWASKLDLQQITEGMEMSEIVPALQEIQRTATDQSLVDATAQVNRLLERCTTPRARQVVERALAQLEGRYAALLEENRRRAEQAAQAIRAARRRKQRLVAAICAAGLVIVVAPYVIVREMSFRGLPARISAACQQQDVARSLDLLEEYLSRGGELDAVRDSAAWLTAELRRLLIGDQARDVRRWAGILARLHGEPGPEGFLYRLARQNHAEALEKEQWREAFIALEQMARYETRRDDAASELPPCIDAAFKRLELRGSEWADAAAVSAALRNFERMLDGERPLARYATRDLWRRLLLLQLDAALYDGALDQARTHARRLDQLDPNVLSGSERIRVYAASLPRKAETALLEGDHVAAMRALRAAIQLVIDQLLSANAWDQARAAAAEMDELLPGGKGAARLSERRRQLLQQAHADTSGADLSGLEALLTAALKLPGDVEDILGVLRRVVESVNSAERWDAAFKLTAALEEPGRGRGVANRGYEELMKRSVRMRDTQRALQAVAKLDELVPPQHGQMQLRHELVFNVLGPVGRELESSGQAARQRAVDTLVSLAPLLLWDGKAWNDFCRNPGRNLSPALLEAYCRAVGAGDNERQERIRQLNQALGTTLDCPEGSR